MIYDYDELSFQILNVHQSKHTDSYFSVKGRPYAALSLRLEGTAEFYAEGKTFVSKPGDIIFIPKDMSYAVDYSGSRIIVVHMYECNYDVMEMFTVENKEYIYEKFDEIYYEWEKKHAINSIKSLVYKVMQYIKEQTAENFEDKEFDSYVEYMDRNFCDPGIDIEKICAEMYVSSSTLRRKFNRYLGMPPKAYLLKLRMNKAIDLLTDGNYSVKETAELCGFSDEKYFARMIKSRYGYAPSVLKQYIKPEGR